MPRVILALALALLCLCACGGCAESTHFRTMPPGAQVFVDDTLVGTGNCYYTVPSHSLGSTPMHYRVEAEGYQTAEGTIATHVAPGRIVGAVFTACITCIFKGFKYPEIEIDVALKPRALAALGPSSPQTDADKLRRIQDLYDQGLMNEQEYKRYRSEILHGAAGLAPPTER